ncbi:MAG: vanadium-dependent haloperoxidase [Acidobacteria bacterium]|nr:vanadium-dependent haloperoxidase [Acidobacteriota bacterium]
MKKHVLTVSSLLLFFILGAAPRVAADEVTQWNETAGKLALDSGLVNHPLFESRLYAMTHAAIHDALNAIDRRYQPYALRIRVTSGASPEAAVATAAYVVLSDQFSRFTAFEFPSQQTALDAAYNNALTAIPNGAAKTAGVLIGRLAAANILALRVADGWDSQAPLDFNYVQGTAPGEYRFTPPFNFAFSTHWGKVRPFVLRDATQFRPGRPYPINSFRYAIDFLEVKNLGGDDVMTPSARTAAQTEIARFWVESSPLQWNRIARTVAVAKGLTLWENARLFGLLNFALADGYISSFDTKYHYKYWRPITAIRLAATDGNPFTNADPMWTPLVTTPPIPDYDSAHSVEGGAAAQVLRRFFNTDEISFSACSTTLPAGSNCSDPTPVKRTYTSFSQAADENGLSRILVGFHFRKAVTEGIARGRRIGDRAANLFLRPVD